MRPRIAVLAGLSPTVAVQLITLAVEKGRDFDRALMSHGLASTGPELGDLMVRGRVFELAATLYAVAGADARDYGPMLSRVNAWLREAVADQARRDQDTETEEQP